MEIEGSCYCGRVTFNVVSHTPYPYMRCYCSMCRKTAGGGADTLSTSTSSHPGSICLPGRDTGTSPVIPMKA